MKGHLGCFIMPLVLALAVSPARADRCDELFARTCQSAPTGPQGQFKDETGYALHFNQNREVARLIKTHKDLIKEKVKGYVDTLAREGTYKKILPFLSATTRTTCAKTPARCHGSVEAEVVELMQFDLSGGVIHAKQFDIANLGLLNSGDDDYGRARADVESAILQDPDRVMEKKLREEVFPLLADRIAKVVRRLVPASAERDAMLTKIAGVRYLDDQCRPIFGAPDVTSIAQITAHYVPDKNAVRICRGFFGTNPSLYPLYNTIAHEMTHSIDPCALMLAQTNPPQAASLRERDGHSPWATVISCLRNKKSTGARNLASTLDPSQCLNDQIGEAIADFVATEVMAELLEDGTLGTKDRTPDQALAGIANIWRYTCRAPYLGKDDPHPSPQSRMERITAVHPTIRAILGCGALPKDRLYCGTQTGAVGPASVSKKN